MNNHYNPNQRIDLTGKKFGRWTVIEFAFIENRVTYWKCQCECGTIRNVSGYNLRKGKSKSCGCLHRELMAKMKFAKTHGLYYENPRLYQIWQNMKNRCYNKNVEKYKCYGARGIMVCDEWIHDFKAFYEWALKNGYNNQLTIDRIDVNGNYEPKNCRWLNMKDQSQNKRTNHYITFQGETKTLQQWADKIGIKSSIIRKRLKRGWDTEKALFFPIKEVKK